MKHFFDRQISLILIIAMLFSLTCLAESDATSADNSDPAAMENVASEVERVSPEAEAAPEELPDTDLSLVTLEAEAAPEAAAEAEPSGEEDGPREVAAPEEAAASEEQVAPTAAESIAPAEAAAAEEVKTVPKKLTLGQGETYDFGIENATVVSNKESVVSVDEQGVITANKKGSAKVKIMVGEEEIGTCKVKVLKAPKKVTLKKTKLALYASETFTLKAKLPSKTASNARIWASSDPEVATVDENGVVTAIRAGTAEITVTTFNMKQATCMVTVNDVPTDVAFPMESITIGKGESVYIEPVVHPGAVLEYTWSSKKKSVAKVDESGTITGKKAGSSTTIAVETQYGNKAKLKVKVKKAPKSVSLSDAAVAPGSAIQLTAVLPDKTASYTLTWESSDNGIATVDGNGVVVGVKAGAAQITVTTYNGIKATCTVTVSGTPQPTTPPEPVVGEFIMANGVVTGYTGQGGNIAIPSVDDDGNAITAIGAGAFMNNASITSVSCPATVTEIGESAFEGCGGLESIKLPNGVARIGKAAFKDCGKLACMTTFG